MKNGQAGLFTSIFISREPHSGCWKLPFSRSELAVALSAMLEAAHAPGAQVELVLAGDAAMESLNMSQLGCTGPTNILSFPAYAAPPLAGPAETNSTAPEAKMPFSPKNTDGKSAQAVHLGSLLLAPETVLRECFIYGQEPQEHILRLLAHGLAHLMGYDHSQEMDALAERMEAAGKKCFT